MGYISCVWHSQCPESDVSKPVRLVESARVYGDGSVDPILAVIYDLLCLLTALFGDTSTRTDCRH